MNYYITEIRQHNYKKKVHYLIREIRSSLTILEEFANVKITSELTNEQCKDVKFSTPKRTGGKRHKFKPYVIIKKDNDPRYARKLIINSMSIFSRHSQFMDTIKELTFELKGHL